MPSDRLPPGLQMSTAAAALPSIILSLFAPGSGTQFSAVLLGPRKPPARGWGTRVASSRPSAKLEGGPSARWPQRYPGEGPSLLSSRPPSSGRRFAESWERSLGHFPCRSPSGDVGPPSGISHLCSSFHIDWILWPIPTTWFTLKRTPYQPGDSAAH